MNNEFTESRQLLLSCPDGYPLGITVFPASNPTEILIIAPALAVPKTYYYRFAQYLATRGITAICFDFRGCGSSIAPSKPFDVELIDWGREDIETVIRFAVSLSEENGEMPVHFLGHSIGGQLVGLAPSSNRLSKLLLVAASAPYWKRWEFPTNVKMLLVSKVLMPLFSSFGRQFPARLVGLGGMSVPSNVTKQWARWMGKPAYFFDPSFESGLASFSALSNKMLALGFSDDQLAPEANIHALLSFFPNASQEFYFVRPDKIGIGSVGHVGYFRANFEDTLWSATAEWLSCDTQFETALSNCISQKKQRPGTISYS